MPKTLQPKKLRIWDRYTVLRKAGFKSNEALRLKIQEQAKEEIRKGTFSKVMLGELISGPKATLIMGWTAELTGKKVETLWPELKDYAA